MKKVLLGLLALSAVSMAAAPNYGSAATPNTNVFQTGQNGEISLAGKLTSEVPVVKYVVFGSVDGTTAEDTLMLKDFILTQDSNSGGFQATNPKVYVKRVNGANDGFIDLESGDEVAFNVLVDSAYTSANNAGAWIKAVGSNNAMESTSLISKTVLEPLAAALGLTVSEYGTIVSTDGATTYNSSKYPVFKVESNGVLVVENCAENRTSTLTAAQTAAVETAFAGGKAISNAKIIVKVD